MGDVQHSVRDFANLIDLLRFRAASGGDKGYGYLPDRAAEVRLSFAELDLQARAVAATLQDRGLAGQRALLCYPPGVEFLVGLFGSLYAGLVAVPLYPPRAHRADDRFDGIVANCDPAVVLTSTQVHRDFERLTAFTPRLHELACIDTGAVSPLHAGTWHPPHIQPQDLAILQYTSGSTGTPRGVMLTHSCVLHNLTRMRQVLGLNESTDGVSWLPAFHDMGLIGNFLQAILCGGSLTFLAPASFVREPLRWLQAISERRAYISGGPCFALQHCVSRVTPEMCAGLDLSCWQVAYIGAEPVSAGDLDRFVELFGPLGFRREALLPTYGLAEATLMVSACPRHLPPLVHGFRPAALEENQAVPDPKGRPLVSCGPAIDDLEIAILDPATAAPLAAGRIGEIWVSGPSVAAGYWGCPDDSAATFAARRFDRPEVPWLRTGDLGFLHNGELFVSGRLKDLIIIHGRNYHPQDIEAAVDAACPELRDQLSAAFSVANESGVSLVLVHEVPRGYKPGDGQDLFTRARQAVAESFDIQLQALVLVRTGSLPRASSGKIRRRECSRSFQAGELEVILELSSSSLLTPPGPRQESRPGVAEMPARDWLTRRLAQQLRLPAERIDPDRPFASYGLDSVAMLTMAADLEKWLGRPVAATELYGAPTIATLARHLAGAPSPATLAPLPSPSGMGPGPIAVVGIGCRFPQCHGPDQFWQALRDGRCLVGDLPAGRWSTTPRVIPTTRGGYLEDVQHFDAAFFGIAPSEAVFIDPQHRLLLETAWEALEHAGLPPDRLAGSSTGVFVGISTNDYGRLVVAHTGYADAYLGTGNSASMAAHRLSYHLDLRGPSVAVDTACSSSLVAVHLACQSLRTGECDLALAGGVSLILAPELTEALARAGMLSPAGRCSAFAAAADGYVRGEGCGVIVLKPLAAALRDGDTVLATLEASALNQDGRSNGITAPSGAAQADLLRRALRLAGRRPEEISYIEAHGTGTPLGDPIEFDGLRDALGADGPPCAIASVKTNLGHLEAAAGVAGLIRTILQIDRGEIAPHLHLDQLNPRVALEGTRFHFPRTLQAWLPPGGPRLAGVSGFGFGGTNAHVIVAQAPEPASITGSSAPSSHLLPLSAQSEPALQELASRMTALLRQDTSFSAADVCATASNNRSHLPNRLAVIGPDRQGLADTLDRWLANSSAPGIQTGVAAGDFSARLAFLFTGQGAQYATMGRHLYEVCAAFRESFDLCARILEDQGFGSLRDVIDDPTRLDSTALAQPALFALEYALAQTWRHWGIEPAALLGHSVGEYVAACVAGVLPLPDALKLITERGRLMDACPQGAMLACFASQAVVQDRLQQWGDQLTVAVVNGPEHVVVAGCREAIDALAADCSTHGIATRQLRVGRAFHCSLIDGALPGLQRVAASITHRPGSIPFISNVTGKFAPADVAPSYWLEHARRPVQFAAGIQSLATAGITHFLEVGPDAVLSRLGPACLPSGSSVWLHSLRHGRDDFAEMQSTLGKLYVSGARVDWRRVGEGLAHRRVALPGYPFQRRRFWFDSLPRAAQILPVVSEEPPSRFPSPHQWQPLSNWNQALRRSSPEFDRDPGHLEPFLDPIVAAVKQQHDLQQLTTVRGSFDRLASLYAIRTLRRLGWVPTERQRVSGSDLADRLGVIPAYRRLLQRLLGMAAEDGWLRAEGNMFMVDHLPDVSHLDDAHHQLLAQFPAFETELKLAGHCASQMHAVMNGTKDPLQVLFGGEAAELTARLYERSPVSRFYNDVVARTVSHLVGPLAVRRPVRVLEVGAGTGGTTTHILPLLPPDRTEYVFTDVSRLFLAQATARFQQYSFVQYRLLDLEQDPDSQGFASGQFDLIVAANVLHATGDLRCCVRHAHQLLAPGGLVLLLEGTGPRRLLDLIFGLTEGWWKFSDTDIRPAYPLVNPARWMQLLLESGFEESTALPAADRDLPDPDQVVVLARKGKMVLPDPAMSAGPRHEKGQAHRRIHAAWELVGPDSELMQALAASLQERGEAVTCHVSGESVHLDADEHGGARAQIVYLHPGSCNGRCGRNRDCWLVTCGAAPLGCATAPGDDWPSLAGSTTGTHRVIDLDPGLTLSERVNQLCEALLRPDDCDTVVYRGDQRYVPAVSSDSSVGHTRSHPVTLTRASLLAMPPFEQRSLLEAYLRQEFASVLGLQLDAADVHKPLQSLGLDSLMGLQVRNRVEAGLGLTLSIVDLLRGLSLSQLIDNALDKLHESAPTEPSAAEHSLPANLTAEGIENLSEGEIDHLLQSLLE